MSEYSLMLIGDEGVGKSALTIQLIQNHFIDEYDPTIEDSYRKLCTVDNGTCLLDILDTAKDIGEWETPSILRERDISNREGFLLVYSITERKSFENLNNYKNLIYKCKEDSENKIPIVIVGNKCDLESARVVSSTEGLNFAKSFLDFNVNAFFETSAKERINVEEAFFQVVRQIREIKPNKTNYNDYNLKKKKCFIL